MPKSTYNCIECQNCLFDRDIKGNKKYYCHEPARPFKIRLGKTLLYSPRSIVYKCSRFVRRNPTPEFIKEWDKKLND